MFAYGVLLPLVAVLVLILAAAGLPEAVQAARGEGQAGTFTAQRQECTRHGCSWYGTFTSDDGSVRLPDVLLDGLEAQRGDRVPALFEGETNPPLVYLAEGSREWVYVLLLMLGSAGYLAWCAWWLVRRRARRSGPVMSPSA